MRRNHKSELRIFNAGGSTGTSTVVDVKDFRNIVVAVSAAANSSLTFKFKGAALSNEEVDLTSAQAVDNIWDYVAVYDLRDPSSVIDGDTGVTLDNDTVANNTRQYLINTDLLNQFAVEITSYTDGSLTTWVFAASD